MPQFWGGFVGDKLDKSIIQDGFGGDNRRYAPALFTTRKEAARQYQDVRKVEVRVVSKPKGRIR